MRINVLFLGPSRDLAGTESASLELADGSSIADLRRVLTDRYGRLGGAMPSIRLAINEDFADDAAVLKDGDEVALIPPVSGGAGGEGILVETVHGPISLHDARAFVGADPVCGAIATFEGITRPERDKSHGPLVRLDYEAHEQMAHREMNRLAVEARKKWNLGRVAMIHRIGSVPVGQTSVVVMVAGGHRQEIFQACHWLIDTLKRDVPIWKKDVYESGRTKWVEPG